MTIPTSGEIPVFPGARHVDSQSVSTVGGGAHLTEWAVDAPLAEVVAFYVERLGRPPETEPDGASKWLFVEDEERPDGKSLGRTHVSVKAAADGHCTLTIGSMSRFERSPEARRAKEEKRAEPAPARPWSGVRIAGLLLVAIAAGVVVYLARH